MTVSEKIYKLRKENNLSQEAFAEKLGVSRQSVSKWESGDVLPDSDKIILMSEIFGVTTDYLLKDNEAEKEITSDEIQKQNLTETAEPEPAEKDSETDKSEKKKDKKKLLKIIAVILAVCVVITAVALPIYLSRVKNAQNAVTAEKIKYPYIFVHGLGGWGEDTGINSAARYWGGKYDLSAHLEEQGIEVYEPSLGPFSSNWDRVCELYAQLTGTRVDYGEAHSKMHNHDRYGETFTTPLVENWGGKINGGQKVKINLVGHSFGGAAVRTLAYLLKYGDKTERDTSGKDVSPLFEGGKGDWVFSVTTLCAPHNGSSLTEALNSFSDGSVILGGEMNIGGFDLSGLDGLDSAQLLAKAVFGIAEVSGSTKRFYDFKLGHFGIGTGQGGYEDAAKALETLMSLGNDHAGYDLSPDGAVKINSYVKTVPDVYYFSYAYCTTEKGKLFGGQVPISGTLPVLIPTAMLMGSYKGKTAGGIEIDESWQENDGLVSVVSAMYPAGEKHFDYDGDAEKLKKGIWNFMGTEKGDHGTVIGMNNTEESTFGFYDKLTEMIESLR